MNFVLFFIRKDKLKDHILIVHHGFTYKCDLCSEEFTRPDKLKQHKKSHNQFLTFNMTKIELQALQQVQQQQPQPQQ